MEVYEIVVSKLAKVVQASAQGLIPSMAPQTVSEQIWQKLFRDQSRSCVTAWPACISTRPGFACMRTRPGRLHVRLASWSACTCLAYIRHGLLARASRVHTAWPACMRDSAACMRYGAYGGSIATPVFFTFCFL